MRIRVGFGFDVHPFKEGRNCILGGVQIAHYKGPDGHSDADVLIHAICDAILGAAGLRDIGTHFPDTDQTFKNADSKKLLEQVMQLIGDKGYHVGNVDCTLVLESPRIGKHVPEMKTTLAALMKIDTDDVAIKATTNEKMGFIGREEGLVAYAAVLLEKP